MEVSKVCLKLLVCLLNIGVTNKKEVVLIYYFMKSGIAKMWLVIIFGKIVIFGKYLNGWYFTCYIEREVLDKNVNFFSISI